MWRLVPTVDLVNTLRRIRDTRTEAHFDEPPARDPNIRALHEAWLIRWHEAPAVRCFDHTVLTDRWVITIHGRVWLAEYDKEALT